VIKEYRGRLSKDELQDSIRTFLVCSFK